VTIKVQRGHYSVGALIAGGTLDVSGGYLSLGNASCVTSQIGRVKLSGGVLNIGRCRHDSRGYGRLVCNRYSPVMPPCTPSDPAASRAVQARWAAFARIVDADIGTISDPHGVADRLLAMLTPQACVPAGTETPISGSVAVICRQKIASLTDMDQGARRLPLKLVKVWAHGSTAQAGIPHAGSVQFARRRNRWLITSL
jgi:hypothetical protein